MNSVKKMFYMVVVGMFMSVSSNVFAMNSAVDMPLQSPMVGLAGQRAEREALDREEFDRMLDEEFDAALGELDLPGEPAVIAPVVPVVAPVIPVAHAGAAQAPVVVQPMPKRLFWAAAGLVACSVVVGEFLYSDYLLPKCLITTLGGVMAYHGYQAAKNIYQVDVIPARERVRNIYQAHVRPAWGRVRGLFQ